MPSRTSFFNGVLFRKVPTRFWPLWGMASFLGSLFPLALLMNFIRYGGLAGGSVDHLEFTYLYYNAAAYAVPILSLLYAILCAMMVWSYLYNARSVGLLHSLPIRREGLFLTNFLAGLTMMLIPYVVAGALCVLVSILVGAFDPVGLMTTILIVLGNSFFYFSTATLAAFITGNLFALPAIYFLLHFVAVLVDALSGVFSNGFIFGLSNDYTGALEWLCPTVSLSRGIRVNAAFDHIVEQGDGYSRSALSSVEIEGLWLLGAYVLAGAALLVLAWLLYRRRRSESAGDVVAVNCLKPVFRYGITALGAAIGGFALYEIFWRDFQSGRYYELLPMLVCMLVAAAISYCAVSMLLERSLKIFRTSWKGLLVTAIGCTVVCCVLRFDLLGIAQRMPDLSDVEEISLYAADNSYILSSGEEDALMGQVMALHQAILADKDYVMDNAQDTWRALSEDEDTALTDISLRYRLKNGRTMYRSYDLLLTKDRMDQEGTYDALLDQLVNSEAMKAQRLHVDDPRYNINGGELYVERDGQHYSLSDREATAILEALGQDAAEGTWGQYDWFGDTDAGDYALSLELSFRVQEEDHRQSHTTWISIRVRPAMTHTTACLQALELVSGEDLVNRRQLNPYAYEVYDSAVSDGRASDAVDEIVYEHPGAEVGIIGGADGPTQVIVTTVG